MEKKTIKISGGFNPPYRSLAPLRIALGVDQDGLDKHVKKLLGQAAVEEVGRREKEADQRRKIAALKRTLSLLKRLYPKEYAEAMEAKRLKGLTARPYTGTRPERLSGDDDALARQEMALRRRTK